MSKTMTMKHESHSLLLYIIMGQFSINLTSKTPFKSSNNHNDVHLMSYSSLIYA